MTFGQEKKKFFLNEAFISINHTIPSTDYMTGKPSFGLAGYHHFFPERRLHLLLGFEWNRTVAKYEEYNAFKTTNPYEYHIQLVMNHLSFPVALRIYINSGKQLFTNLGASLDINVYSKKKFYQKDEGYELFDGPGFIGFNAGLGYEFPLKKHTLILISDYKLAFNSLLGGHSNRSPIRYARILIGLRF